MLVSQVPGGSEELPNAFSRCVQTSLITQIHTISAIKTDEVITLRLAGFSYQTVDLKEIVLMILETETLNVFD